jgi:hypothetical protein
LSSLIFEDRISAFSASAFSSILRPSALLDCETLLLLPLSHRLRHSPRRDRLPWPKMSKFKVLNYAFTSYEN